MKSSTTRGVVYVAGGTEYVEEAHRSAASVKRHHPGWPTLLFADHETKGPAFDRVVVEPDLAGFSSKEEKIACMARSPFEETLFLDTDTYVCDEIGDLFRLLDAFDLAAAHAPNRLYHKPGTPRGDLPVSFPEMNTGVLLFRSNAPTVRALFSAWRDRYVAMRSSGVERDQLSFREVLFESDVRVATLPPEYNCRFAFPIFLDGAAKILHGRHSDYEAVARYLNADTGRRVIHPRSFRLPARAWLKSAARQFAGEVRTFFSLR